MESRLFKFSLMKICCTEIMSYHMNLDWDSCKISIILPSITGMTIDRYLVAEMNDLLIWMQKKGHSVKYS